VWHCGNDNHSHFANQVLRILNKQRQPFDITRDSKSFTNVKRGLSFDNNHPTQVVQSKVALKIERQSGREVTTASGNTGNG
jgi:hypothetical protein